MFENLRESAESSFYEEELSEISNEPAAATALRRTARFLGMTPMQRFFITVMLMFTVCIIGTLAMLILGKMSLF